MRGAEGQRGRGAEGQKGQKVSWSRVWSWCACAHGERHHGVPDGNEALARRAYPQLHVEAAQVGGCKACEEGLPRWGSSVRASG